MAKVYVVYSWVAKQGRDREFVSKWREFAKWIVNQNGSMKSTRLFGDMSSPNHFLSVDSWEEERALETLQAGGEYNSQLRDLRKLLDDFSSWSLKLEAEQRA